MKDLFIFRFGFLCYVLSVNVKISKFLNRLSLEVFNVQSTLTNLEEEFNHWLNFIAALPFLQTFGKNLFIVATYKIVW